MRKALVQTARWQRAAPRRQLRAISAGQPWLGSLPAQNRQLVAQDENLELLQRRGRASSQTSASRFRTTRYANDQSKKPSLDH
jgi:hypothetical protein